MSALCVGLRCRTSPNLAPTYLGFPVQPALAYCCSCPLPGPPFLPPTIIPAPPPASWAYASGEYHSNNQTMAKLLHKAIGLGDGSASDPEAYKAYQQHFVESPVAVLRDCLEVNSDRKPIPLEQVGRAWGTRRGGHALWGV